jgi:hypothetical protein
MFYLLKQETMPECKNYESTRENEITILVKKDDPDVVIVARKRLLEVCTACPEADKCEDATLMYRALKQ